ncbi:citrate lyase beta subunit [Tumebacillus sp. BK434]|uniref:HpcH/HpaI aldolase/citrate lyase family protein n=1 Tax=Tumebacillus sp. BK434 TaxID=2512169 RepID=UPI001051A270|nr:HpcH/HpaI aldolase/citrate lyase family protein [Tumebacillus sp. BK434]TCP57925.1 citrate lyase beta subunit [Tumebacillus sp. BK434]
MRYFSYLSTQEEMAKFHQAPVYFNNTSSRDILSYAAGAALYTPATRLTVAEDILNQKHEGLVSIVLDLEDAIGDHQVEMAEEVLLQQLFKLDSYLEIGTLDQESLPLIFIRVRHPEQLETLIERLAERIVLITGFFFPKFSLENGERYFRILETYQQHKAPEAPVLYGSPILESSEIMYLEQRLPTLLGIKAILDRNKERVLNVRIGATDFSSLFGVRRSVHHTIYDITTIRNCISDIVNILGRAEDGYVISGPVWEYFSRQNSGAGVRDERIERIAGHYGLQPVTQSDYGLIREVLLDKENGLIGKTIIHPSQLKIVQSLYAVTCEEYQDAVNILENCDGNRGVIRSDHANKMNEIKPHLNWAKRILAQAAVYGVLHDQENVQPRVVYSGQAYV